MIAVAMYMAITFSTSVGPTTNWYADLRCSQRARHALTQPVKKKSVEKRTSPNRGPIGKPSSANERTASDAPNGGKKHALLLHPNTNPDHIASLERDNALRAVVYGLIDEKKYEEAYECFHASVKENSADTISDLAAACTILTGRYTEAYDLLVRLIDRQGRGDRTPANNLLALSIASVALGDVYQGQAEFCRDQANQGLKDHALINVPLDNQLAKRTDAKGIMIMACIGLALNCGESCYLELALKLDPANVMIANELVLGYQIHERKADVQRIASGMLKSLPAGDSHRADFEKVLDEAK